jgi:hypothetical protein
LENEYTIEEIAKLYQYLCTITDNYSYMHLAASLKGDIGVRLLGGSPPEQFRHLIKTDYTKSIYFMMYGLLYDQLPLYINIINEPECAIIKWRLNIGK